MNDVDTFHRAVNSKHATFVGSNTDGCVQLLVFLSLTAKLHFQRHFIEIVSRKHSLASFDLLIFR